MRTIDADAFIEENKEIIDCEIDHPKYQDTLRELIDQAPTLPNPCGKPCAFERPHGEWIETSNIWETEDLSGWGYYKECSNCHIQVRVRTPFCPYCGAMMKKEGVKQNE